MALRKAGTAWWKISQRSRSGFIQGVLSATLAEDGDEAARKLAQVVAR